MKMGFEAEFRSGAETLAAKLHDLGLWPDPSLHGYHCGCEYCTDYDDVTFRCQRDSSCGGEVISKPFDDWRTARRAMTALQDAAIEVDAEPGMDAGFHVHVSVEDLSLPQRQEAWFQFIRWERTLEELAAGRFHSMRGFNNPARTEFVYGLYRQDIDYRDGTWVTELLNERPEPDRLMRTYNDFYECGDRHCAINTRGNSGRTFEFRLWNSTRSAWRMHMFAAVSRAFVLPAYIERVSNEIVTGDAQTDIDSLRNHLAAVMPRSTAPSLIDRQLNTQRTDDPFSVASVPAIEAPTWEALARAAGWRPPVQSAVVSPPEVAPRWDVEDDHPYDFGPDDYEVSRRENTSQRLIEALTNPRPR